MLDTTIQGETNRLLALATMVDAAGYDFVTPTPATHARVIARRGLARNLPDVFGWSLPFAEGLLSPALFQTMQDAGILAGQSDHWRSTIRFSRLDGMLFMHSAYPTLAPDSVFFGPDTYRFAQAIAVTRTGPVRRAVDIGCGAGPGAMVVAKAHPHAETFGVDINPAALRMTQVNAALAGLPVQAVHSDLLSAVPGTFDLIVANPPYLLDPAERAYRHGGGTLGAGLSLSILNAAAERLAPGGTLVLYTGSAIHGGHDGFRTAAAARLAGSTLSWTYREMDPDVFGEELETAAYAACDRIAAVVLTATREG